MKKQQVTEDFADFDTSINKEDEDLNEEENLDLGKDNDIFSDEFDLDFQDNTQTNLKKQADLLRDLTNFTPFIREKVNGWLGLRWSEDEQKYVRDGNIEPIMNQKCAAWCIDYLKTYTRENNLITDIGKDEYKYLITDIIMVVWYDIGCRAEHFGIKSNEDLHRICVEMQHAAELILMGAGDGKYNKFFGSATSRHETVSLGRNEADMRPKDGGDRGGFMKKMKKMFGVT